MLRKKGDNVEMKSQVKNVLKICKVSDNAKIPYHATEGAAGMDLCACIEKEIVINPQNRVLIPTGIAISLPLGMGAFIFARSGLSIKHGITLSNGVGVIDSDYRGEIGVGLCNLGNAPYTIKNGERIAQMVIMKVENPIIEVVSSLDETARGSGGFGSTGK